MSEHEKAVVDGGLDWIDTCRAEREHLWAEHGDVLTAFHRVFYAAKCTWRTAVWRGKTMMKAPGDVLMYAEIVQEMRPDLIIETGTAEGGSALFLRDMQRVAGVTDGLVVTVELEPKQYSDAVVQPGLIRLIGSSTHQVIFDTIGEMATRAARVMVILDSDHRAEHVARELELYAQMVSVGQWLIVEDTNLNHEVPLNLTKDWWCSKNGVPLDASEYPRYAPGPREALEAWLPSHPEFRVERYCERFLATFNPEGYLLRIA